MNGTSGYLLVPFFRLLAFLKQISTLTDWYLTQSILSSLHLMAKKTQENINFSSDKSDSIVLEWIKTNNLKNIDLILPKNQIITFTWVSWSWKSSLAFETIYKEGQFRYIESLSSYLRQFFNLWERPDIAYCAWLSPAIAIEQNKRWWNSRSTVGTLTEIDDYIRLLFA